MNPSFHNTVNLEGPELARHEGKAINLETRITRWLQARAGQKLTPIEIWQMCCPECLLQSVRRALSNLVRDGVLKDTRYTEEKKMERYGTSNYFWYYPAAPVSVDENGQIEMI